MAPGAAGLFAGGCAATPATNNGIATTVTKARIVVPLPGRHIGRPLQSPVSGRTVCPPRPDLSDCDFPRDLRVLLEERLLRLELRWRRLHFAVHLRDARHHRVLAWRRAVRGVGEQLPTELFFGRRVE